MRYKKLILLIGLTLELGLLYGQNVTQESYKTFELSNQFRHQELAKAIRKLPINACITRVVKVSIDIAEDGKTISSQIIEGTSNAVLDSMIVFTIMNFEGKWIPLMDKLEGVKISQVFGFTLVNVYSKKSVSNSRGIKYNTVTHSKVYNVRKNCEDNEYYYSKGVEDYTNKKYKNAKYNFISALKSNSKDLDSQYNLGMCYIKLGKLDKACECFEEAAKYGDKGALEQLKKCID